MKNYFFGMIIFSITFIATSCSDERASEDIQIELSDQDYFKRNVSLFDARVRSLSESDYLRELYFANLGSEASRMPSQVNFQGESFFDNGTENDLIKGDGIYTSISTFKHDSNITYDVDQLIKSVLGKPIVNPGFDQEQGLHNLADNYDLRKNQVQTRIFEITCDVEFGTTGCLAQRWGWCDSCCVTVYTDTCSISIGF